MKARARKMLNWALEYNDIEEVKKEIRSALDYEDEPKRKNLSEKEQNLKDAIAFFEKAFNTKRVVE